MNLYLGVDTSNYTTSVACCADGRIVENLKKSVYVAENERGVRQSDALFCHVKNLPELMENLGRRNFSAIGYSARPRDVDGSYMPCFLAGEMLARSLAAAAGVPALPFSHQAGHVRAAIYSSGADKLLGARFLAFHVSGGTTELLLVENGRIQKIGGTVDLTAGQAIDRIGVRLGLRFPCGQALEELAKGAPAQKAKVCVRGLTCNLSGLENQAAKMLEEGRDPRKIAAYTIAFVGRTVEELTLNAQSVYGKLPVLFAGGVMSCSIIRGRLNEMGGEFYFADPAFSCDNAAGTALLCMDRMEARKGGEP